VPYALDRGGPADRQADLQPTLRNHGWIEGGETTAVLDFGARAPKSRLLLRLSGDNFRRRVAVAGSDDGGTWSTLVEEAWVFAIPGQEPTRYEAIELPFNDHPLLRVAVWPGQGERERVRIEGAHVPGAGTLPFRERELRPSVSRASDPVRGESWVTLELGARHQPFRSLTLEVEDARFFREARVEARRDWEDTREGALGGARWVEIGRGAVYRLEGDGRTSECLRLAVSGRERALRVVLRDGDDRPLAVRGAVVAVPVERLLFEARPGRSYRLTYGQPHQAPPVFDLERGMGDPAAWAAAASPAELGPLRPMDDAASGARAWTERHPWLLWAGLLAVVAILGGLTVRALRGA
jgi:hypothetical protein